MNRNDLYDVSINKTSEIKNHEHKKRVLKFTETFDFEKSIKNDMNSKVALKYYAQDKSDNALIEKNINFPNISYSTLFLFQDKFKINVTHTIEFNEDEERLSEQLLNEHSQKIHSLFKEFLTEKTLA